MNKMLYIEIYIIISINTPGTAGGPGGRDQTLAVKGTKKSLKNQLFFVKK